MGYSFSIITPAYNAAKWIKSTIESIINTNYDKAKVEYFIIDDGSTDNTYEVVKPYLEKHNWIKYIKKPNSNWGGVINYAIDNKLINNDYVLICDSDDLVLPKAFQYVNKYANDGDLIYGSTKLWNGKKIKIGCYPYYWMFRTNVVNKKGIKVYTPINVPNAIYIKKDLFYQTDRLVEKVPHQDTILFSNLFFKAKSIKYIRKSVSYYYKWREGNTMTNFNKHLPIIIKNCQTLAQKGLVTAVYFYILGSKPMRKYLKKEKIKFDVETSDTISLKWFPFFIRWLGWILYLCIVKKYINIKK